ncbi:MAG: hypothetical protein QXJ63_03495 [Candidatus Bathyarchaeia archaeon]
MAEAMRNDFLGNFLFCFTKDKAVLGMSVVEPSRLNFHKASYSYKINVLIKPYEDVRRYIRVENFGKAMFVCASRF